MPDDREPAELFSKQNFHTTSQGPKGPRGQTDLVHGLHMPGVPHGPVALVCSPRQAVQRQGGDDLPGIHAGDQ